jgi:hypothetical protein
MMAVGKWGLIIATSRDIAKRSIFRKVGFMIS